MFRRYALTSFRRGGVRQFADIAPVDVRSQILSELKAAMKAKNTVKSTTIRSVLTEVYSVDKQKSELIPSNKIQDIIRKAVDRRTQVAEEYVKAMRPDLAEKELTEAAVLAEFLPPQLSEEEIDRVLREVIEHKIFQVLKIPSKLSVKSSRHFTHRLTSLL
ncbi:hypothetical protein QCA50_011716 [Cerrena zonata]|uniref:Altered inheritance of mitochondria protein 41 n=1 Tax=Cerrena zonata TaxID=2478898 RepID=A0AAW0G1F0_9APHY